MHPICLQMAPRPSPFSFSAPTPPSSVSGNDEERGEQAAKTHTPPHVKRMARVLHAETHDNM